MECQILAHLPTHCPLTHFTDPDQYSVPLSGTFACARVFSDHTDCHTTTGRDHKIDPGICNTLEI